MDSKAIGNNIGNQIAMKRMTQRECAEKLGITEVSLSRYISGTRIPKAPLIFKMSKLFGCTVEDLCAGIDE